MTQVKCNNMLLFYLKWVPYTHSKIRFYVFCYAKNKMLMSLEKKNKQHECTKVADLNTACSYQEYSVPVKSRSGTL